MSAEIHYTNKGKTLLKQEMASATIMLRTTQTGAVGMEETVLKSLAIVLQALEHVG